MRPVAMLFLEWRVAFGIVQVVTAISRLILDFNDTIVCVENETLTAASLDLYATVDGDLDGLRT